MECMKKTLPMFCDDDTPMVLYGRLLFGDDDFQNPNHVKALKESRDWFENCKKIVEKRKQEINAEKELDKVKHNFEELQKQIRKHQKDLDDCYKKKNDRSYKTERNKIKEFIKKLKDLKYDGANDLINELEKLIVDTKGKRKILQMENFLAAKSGSLILALGSMKDAFESNDIYSIEANKKSLKESLRAFELDVERFEGDVDKLKKMQKYIELVDEVNEMLKKEPEGGKTVEIVNMEQMQVPTLNAYQMSIDSTTSMPPNQFMIPSLTMMKTQMLTAYNQIKPMEDKSEIIKNACLAAEASFKKIDEYLAKCAAPPS
ncbi:hypothetical protein GPJ56_008850 [Histomonas meleagridis]|uniref:uncharacterized protein n=1 Tax=Histomonas meleagridis TaxID=135588 RepID=UPI00355A0CFC|nr:hypothetical protein GPJ56_008850 [Histomonas meleagridis]KAH0805357.1 hypothetical protein GO595_001739 [Histomonas meleagridis]